MLNGYEREHHAVRNIHELVNTILGGSGEFSFPRTWSEPDGLRESVSLKYWRGETLQSVDLIDYIEGDSLTRLALNAMIPSNQVIPLGRYELLFRSFCWDVRAFAGLMRQHPLAQDSAEEVLR
jgi:hypothetical protein